MKLAIVANEFFDEKIGRFGGFGWAARQVATFFNSRPDLGVDVVFFAADIKNRTGARYTRVHDTPLIFESTGAKYREIIRNHAIDLVLTIDYRPRYRRVLSVLEHVPTIVWVRDPRPPSVVKRLATLTIPGDSSARPQGINVIDCTSLANLTDPRLNGAGSLVFATPAPSLGSWIEDAYGVANQECTFLPNIVDSAPQRVTKSEHPRVIFLARLDPIKRPWLFVELGRRFPEVEFLMLGQSHFRGPGSWIPRHVSENVKLLGHVDGPKKVNLLTSSWVLVNTSIHEALAISFLEALACQTPLLACTNQEHVVSRFGIFTGAFNGDGMEGLPHFEAHLRRLLGDRSLRIDLGKRGRTWVERTHNAANFLRAFDNLCTLAGVPRWTRRSRRSSAIPSAEHSKHVGGTPMLMPNIFVIGAAKSATTSLHHYLGQHPDVFMTRRKEPRFFAYENERMRYGGPNAVGRVGLNARTIECEKYSNSVTKLPDYYALFRRAGGATARGESSTVYLYLPKAIDRIRYYCPNAKLFAVLRHPADRAYSKYSQMIRDRAEPIGTFHKALSVEPRRIASGWAPAWHYRQRGYYYAQLSKIYERFDAARILIVTFDEFTHDTRSVMKKIYGFIGVDDSFVPDVSEKYNVSARKDNQADHRGFDPELRAALIAEYREDILRLGDLIEKDLSRWLV